MADVEAFSETKSAFYGIKNYTPRSRTMEPSAIHQKRVGHKSRFNRKGNANSYMWHVDTEDRFCFQNAFIGRATMKRSWFEHYLRQGYSEYESGILAEQICNHNPARKRDFSIKRYFKSLIAEEMDDKRVE